MKVAHIVPIAHLEDTRLHGDYFYALAHIARQSQEYLEFFRKKAEDGECVLLDNSAYELGESIPDDELLSLAVQIKPMYVYAPDVVGSMERTLPRTFRFLDQVRAADYEFEVIGVIHGNSVIERVNVYIQYISAGLTPAIPPEDYKVHHLANVPDFGTRVMLKRMYFCDMVEVLGGEEPLPNVPSFFTGIGNPVEIACSGRDWIIGVDSSTCCVHGSKGLTFDVGLGIKKQQEKLDFFIEYDETQLEYIYQNIDILNSWSRIAEVKESDFSVSQ